MRGMFALVFVVGLALAGAAVYLAQGYMRETQSQLAHERAVAAAAVPTVKVYAVTRAMAYGEQITHDDVERIDYPVAHLPDGAFHTEDELFPLGPEVRRVVLRPLEAREPVLAVKVTAPGEEAGLTSRLSPGMRAFAIRVDVASGVSGFLRPGDRVDIYWTGPATARSGALEDVTKLIERSVPLVAVDQQADGSSFSATIARTVTVAASPQQVATLAQAQSTGTLSLSLVGAEDDTLAEAIEVDQMQLLGIEDRASPEPRATEEDRCSVRTRRGSEVVEIPVPCTH